MDPSVLVVDDDGAMRESMRDALEMAGFHVLEAADGASALALLGRHRCGLVLSDVRMEGMDGIRLLGEIRRRHPGLPVLLATAHGTVAQAVEAMREGAVDYLVKGFEAEVLVGRVARYFESGAGEAEGDGVVAVDPASRALVDLARQVAESDVSVLLLGESGTGKEVLARQIHRWSARREGPFVAVNCAAIPENMLEAILFGYERGAYTGAHRACPGKFEQAQGGTLLLDEVSEMALSLQAKLLRVLQEREVERLGAREVIRLDVRVVATTNRDLREEVARGTFREDLYYRLNVFPLALEPLRRRPGDVEALAEHLLARAARAAGRPIPVLEPAARAALAAHSWPGNVRELDNVMQRALVLCPGPSIGPGHLRFEAAPATVPGAAGPARETLDDGLREREQRLIIEALAAGGGSRKAAAEKLGISPRTLRYKLARMRAEGVAVP